MNLLLALRKIALEFLHIKTTDWWVEINTTQPRCTYYFGPFDTLTEAKTAQFGYIEDLQNEKAQGLSVSIKDCQPSVLTIFDEDD